MEEKVGILLVDDDEAVRGLARVILEHQGWQVVEAGSLREATGLLRDCVVRPHIALVDLLLPDGVGTDLAEDLRRARTRSRTVYITGDPAWLRRLNAGNESVLAKPFTPTELVAAVRVALDAQRPVVVFVEPGRVYRHLLVSALEHTAIAVVMAASFSEGLLLAHERNAAVLFTHDPGREEALAELACLRQCLPTLEVIALDADQPDGGPRWYDDRLLRSYSVQELIAALRRALLRQQNWTADTLIGSEAH